MESFFVPRTLAAKADLMLQMSGMTMNRVPEVAEARVKPVLPAAAAAAAEVACCSPSSPPNI